MARLQTYTFGNEVETATAGATVENVQRAGTAGVITFDTAVKRYARASLKFSYTPYGTANAQLVNVPGGPGEVYVAFYLRIPSWSNEVMSVYLIHLLNGNSITVDMNGTRQLRISGTGMTASSYTTSAVSLDTWTLVELHLKPASGSSVWDLKTMGETVSGTKTDVTSTFTSAWFMVSGNFSRTIYIADYAVNDTSGSYQNSWIGEHYSKYLRPISDNTISLWTDGAGGATDIYAAIDNDTPTGNSSEDATTNIRAAGGDADNATFNVTKYSTGGINSDDTINLIQVVARMGMHSAVANHVQCGCDSNPTISGVDTALGATAHGTEPVATWFTIRSAIAYVPSVTLNVSAIIDIYCLGNGTGVPCCDWAGLLVDVTLGTGTVTPVQLIEKFKHYIRM